MISNFFFFQSKFFVFPSSITPRALNCSSKTLYRLFSTNRNIYTQPCFSKEPKKVEFIYVKNNQLCGYHYDQNNEKQGSTNEIWGFIAIFAALAMAVFIFKKRKKIVTGFSLLKKLGGNHINETLSRNKVPGIQIVLSKGLSRNFRIVRNAGSEIGDNTLFEACSLSKPLFAYGVLKLVENGQIDLDVPLVKYYPNIKNDALYSDIKDDPRFDLITARMVLSHTTGFPNWRTGKLKIHFTPGERFSYSGEGFYLLQKIVEEITGEKLEDYMERSVLSPLGMKKSSFIFPNEKKFFGTKIIKTKGHDREGNVVQSRSWGNSISAASLHTTAKDYSKFVLHVVNSKSPVIKEMMIPQIRVGKEGHDSVEKKIQKNPVLSDTLSWGLGWGLFKKKGSDRINIWHWGCQTGYRCFVNVFEDGMTVVILTNGENGENCISEILENIHEEKLPYFDWIEKK